MLIKFLDISQWKSATKKKKWVDPMGKIWPNLTTEHNINEAPLT